MSPSDSPVKEGGYGSTMMCKVIKARMDREQCGRDPHQELKHYLESPLETVDDLVKWWGVSNDFYLFIIAHLTHASVSFLAVPHHVFHCP